MSNTEQAFDLTTCKLCGHTNNHIHYNLRMSKVYVCDACGFHYSNFLDDEYDAAHEQQTDVLLPSTIEYVEKKLQFNPPRFENHVAKTLTYTKPSHKKLLDIGFGGGLYMNIMREKGFDVYGIELDIQRLLYAKQFYGFEHAYSYPVQDDFWQKNYQGFFDVIVLWDVIEHVNFPKELIQAASKLLKKDGILLIDTPCRDAFYHRFGETTAKLSGGKYPTFLHDMYSNHPFGHKQILSKKDVKQIFDASGLVLTSIDVFHELSFPHEFYLKKILKSESLAKKVAPLTRLFFKVFKIQNKMLVVGTKQ